VRDVLEELRRARGPPEVSSLCEEGRVERGLMNRRNEMG